jgi:hypothetical protein
MASAQAATSLDEQRGHFACPVSSGFMMLCVHLFLAFPSGTSAEVHVQNGRKFTGKQQTLQEFSKVRRENSASP